MPSVILASSAFAASLSSANASKLSCFAAKMPRMRSSMLSSHRRRKARTLRVWPMRYERATA